MHTFNMIIRQKGKDVYYQEDLKKAITRVFSSHFPPTFLSQNPSKCSLEFDARATRRASFTKLARSGGEAKITPLSRNS